MGFGELFGGQETPKIADGDVADALGTSVGAIVAARTIGGAIKECAIVGVAERLGEHVGAKDFAATGAESEDIGVALTERDFINRLTVGDGADIGLKHLRRGGAVADYINEEEIGAGGFGDEFSHCGDLTGGAEEGNLKAGGEVGADASATALNGALHVFGALQEGQLREVVDAYVLYFQAGGRAAIDCPTLLNDLAGNFVGGSSGRACAVDAGVGGTGSIGAEWLGKIVGGGYEGTNSLACPALGAEGGIDRGVKEAVFVTLHGDAMARAYFGTGIATAAIFGGVFGYRHQKIFCHQCF